MAKIRKELSNDTKDAIIPLFESRLKHAEISRMLGIPRTTVSCVIKRYRERGSVVNIPRRGAHSKLKARDTRGLLRIVKRNRKRGLTDITALFNENRGENVTVSKRTIQRTLYKEGYFRRVVRKRIRIREVNRKYGVEEIGTRQLMLTGIE